MKQYIGIDIGGTEIKFGRFSSGGKLLEKWKIDTNTHDCGESVLIDIKNSIFHNIHTNNIDIDAVQGIGMGVPGPVVNDSLIKGCVNIGWGTVNGVEEMQRLTGIPTKVGNDANVAALGEQWMGAGKGFANMVMITLGTGVGAGIILDNAILSGYNGGAGEIGHICVDQTETEACTCGLYGCLEQFASARGVVRVAKKELIHQQSVLSSIDEFTAKDIFDGAKEGDVVCLKTVKKTTNYLGFILAQISCVVNPEAFIIGGGMANAGQFMLDMIEESYRKKVFHSGKDARILLASLGNDAGIFGAAKLAMK